MIRPLRAGDLPAASALCMDAFTHAVAPSLSAQGIATFAAVAAQAAFAQRMTLDNGMWVFDRDGTLYGVAELRQGRHVGLLFVAPNCQRQGVGRALMEALLAHARAPEVTVSASLNSVPAYQRYGFDCTGPVAEAAGLVYQPMQRPRLLAA